MLELVDVSRIYEMGDDTVHALSGFSYTFHNGSMTVVSGPSGSGKSTLLNLIGAMDVPTSGDIRLDGRSIVNTSDKDASAYRFNNIGYIFQQFRLVPVLDVFENILLGAIAGESRRKDRKVLEKDVEEIMERVGLSDRRHHRPSELSGGQQQRVAIARALVKKPSIILADEPTASLDSVTAEDIMSLLGKLNKELGSICIVATHDKRIVDRVGDKIRLEDGRIAG